MTRAGQAALHGGVTTVRDLGDRGYLSLELRGQPGLPTIVAAGPPITTPGGHCHYLGGATAPTVDGVRAAVREHAAQGVDVIKIMASGGNLTPGSRQDLAQFPSDVLRAAVDEAHWLGLQVTVHAHAVAAIADAVAAGVDGLEHATFWTEDGVDAPAHLIRMIAGQQIAVGATVGFVPVPGMAGPPPAVAARMPGIIAIAQRLYEAGACMVAGTDAGIAPVKPHDVVRHAPPMLRQLGFGPAEALRAITSAAAGVCGLGHCKGRIAPGFDADILAVDGDPVADPGALHHIRAVYARGAAVRALAYGLRREGDDLNQHGACTWPARPVSWPGRLTSAERAQGSLVVTNGRPATSAMAARAPWPASSSARSFSWMSCVPLDPEPLHLVAAGHRVEPLP